MQVVQYQGFHFVASGQKTMLLQSRPGRLGALVSMHIQTSTVQIFHGDPDLGGAMIGTVGNNQGPVSSMSCDMGEMTGTELWALHPADTPCLMVLEVWR